MKILNILLFSIATFFSCFYKVESDISKEIDRIKDPRMKVIFMKGIINKQREENLELSHKLLSVEKDNEVLKELLSELNNKCKFE